MKTLKYLFLSLLFTLFTNAYSQNISSFKSLFKEIPKDGIILSPRTDFEINKVIDSKFYKMLDNVDSFNTKLYPICKITIKDDYIIFIIGRNGMYTESGSVFILLELYDIKQNKFKYLDRVTGDTSDEGYRSIKSSIISDFNNDGFYDILSLDDSKEMNGPHTYYSFLKIWNGYSFIEQKMK